MTSHYDPHADGVICAATLDDAAADPALTLDVARGLLRDAAAGIRYLYARAAAHTEPAEGREAVRGSTLRFGLGAWIVNTGTYGGEPCVFIDDAPTWGKVGERAPDVPPGVKPFMRLLFPTAEQAKAVQLALTTPAAGDGARVTEAIQRVREAELFEDGVEADLCDAGITTMAAAFMEGRLDALRELEVELAKREGGQP